MAQTIETGLFQKQMESFWRCEGDIFLIAVRPNRKYCHIIQSFLASEKQNNTEIGDGIGTVNVFKSRGLRGAVDINAVAFQRC